MAWEGACSSEPWTRLVPDGGSISLSGKAWFFDAKMEAHSCTSWIHGQHFFLRGARLIGDQFTMIAARQLSDSHQVVVDATAASSRPQGLLDSNTSTDVIDDCAGLSVMSAGYLGIQCKVRCHVEINPRYADWLKAKQVPVILGDANSTAVHQALEPFAETPCIVSQPFSLLGDRRQELDQRAKSFEGMFKTCYLFQPDAMIIECTKEASTSPGVPSTLHAMSQATGYSLQQQVCQLQDFWPAKRTRWWDMLVHPQVKISEIQQFPCLPFTPSSRHLIPTLANGKADQLQAVWHGAQVVQALRQTFGLDVHAPMPEEGLKHLVNDTFEARDQMPQPFEHTRESSLFQQAVLAKFGLSLVQPP